MIPAELDPVPAPVLPPPPPVLPEPDDRLCALLKPEVERGLVRVQCTPSTATVRVRNRGMFASGSATVEPAFTALLGRIGAALKDERGAVRVIGYTDNQPIHTVQFPSNFQLSAARASVVPLLIRSSMMTATFPATSPITASPLTTPALRYFSRKAL